MGLGSDLRVFGKGALVVATGTFVVAAKHHIVIVVQNSFLL
jgi:hypothetical protein